MSSAQTPSQAGKTSGADEVVEHPPFTPTLPAVNLLPAKVRDAITVRKVRRVLVAAGLVVVVGAGALWYLQGERITTSRAVLSAAQAESEALQEQVDSLAAVKSFDAELDSQRELVRTTLAAQAKTTEIVRRLTLAGQAAGGGGDGIVFDSIGITYQGVPAPGAVLNSCPNPDPFGEQITIGCLTFSATAATRQQVSRLLEILEEDPIFVGSFVTSTSLSPAVDTDGGSVAFTGTSGLSVDGLVTALTPEEIEAIVRPEPTDADTADESSQP